MNMLRKVEIEVKKIKNVITGYTDEGPIVEIFELLNDAVTGGDKEEILYHLKDISGWYERNISKIRSNEYVFNFDEHELAVISVNKMVEDLEKFKGSLLPTNVKHSDEIITEETIFISHSSLDKSVVDLLANELQKLNIEIDYTSIVPMNHLDSG